METMTDTMRHRVRRIHSPHRHRRPVPAATPSPSSTARTTAGATAEPRTPATEVRYESPLPHAAWIVGGFLLTLAAGVMLGVGVANVMG